MKYLLVLLLVLLGCDERSLDYPDVHYTVVVQNARTEAILDSVSVLVTDEQGDSIQAYTDSLGRVEFPDLNSFSTQFRFTKKGFHSFEQHDEAILRKDTSVSRVHRVLTIALKEEKTPSTKLSLRVSANQKSLDSAKVRILTYESTIVDSLLVGSSYVGEFEQGQDLEIFISKAGYRDVHLVQKIPNSLLETPSILALNIEMIKVKKEFSFFGSFVDDSTGVALDSVSAFMKTDEYLDSLLVSDTLGRITWENIEAEYILLQITKSGFQRLDTLLKVTDIEDKAFYHFKARLKKDE